MRETTLFDAKYTAVAAESYRMTAVRLATAAVLTMFLGIGVGWSAAWTWAAVTCAFEACAFITSRPNPQGASPSQLVLSGFFFATLGGAVTWSSVGLLFWLTSRPACHLAAIAFWAGHLMYVQNFYLKSRASILHSGTVAVIAPAIVPLLFPRFHGVEQLIVVGTLLSCVFHAIYGAWVSLQATTALEGAQATLLEAREQSQVASQAKTNFLAVMSHEIRTPLNGVLGMAQAMERDDLSLPQRERLKIMRQSSESLLAVLNDVLDLSKIEAGKLTLEVIDFDLRELMQSAINTYAPIAAAKGVALILDANAASGVYRGDPTRIRQILQNLLSNALKFTSQGEVRVAADWAPEQLTIRVADTGAGIEPTILGFLFDKFTQAEVSTTRKFGGTGLGLSICRDLAQLMAGSISVQSQLGSGSTFSLVLPLGRVEGSKHPAANHRAASDGAIHAVPELRVLAAEDHPVNQQVLKTLLGLAGIEPVIVENGEQAVEAYKNGEWDLILMDVQMPVMDGVDATRRIRAEEAASGRQRTQILALTANAMTHQVGEYLAAGMDGHLAKPIDAAALFEALDQMSDRLSAHAGPKPSRAPMSADGEAA